jgi:hypothetical protein
LLVRPVLGVVGAAMLLAPTSASAALIGPPDIGGSAPNLYRCNAQPCTFVNLEIPEGRVRSPISGHITRWRVSISSSVDPGTGPVSLQVLKRTVNEPGDNLDEFKAVRESDFEATEPGKQGFDAHLRIRKGQYIALGIEDDGTGTAISAEDIPKTDNHWGEFEPMLMPDDPASMFSAINTEGYLFYNATVKE